MSARVIAEVAQAHDGSLGTALAYIDAVADAGADAVKFQTHIAAAESTPAEPWRVRFSPQDESRYAYWRRMEFSEAQWGVLRDRAQARGIGFLSSPFSREAAELLERVGVDCWKIASGEVADLSLLDLFERSAKPVYLSTGMSPWEEIDQAVEALLARGLTVTVLQCTSMYPTPPEKAGLNVLAVFRARYPRCEVGWSDHSGRIHMPMAAAALGASVIEVHVCLSRDGFGPDIPVSLTPGELRGLVEGVREIGRALGSPVEKDELARELEPMRQLFTKSLVIRQPLTAGTLLGPGHLVAKKPGTGIPATELTRVIGRSLGRDVGADHLLDFDDLVPLADPPQGGEP